MDLDWIFEAEDKPSILQYKTHQQYLRRTSTTNSQQASVISKLELSANNSVTFPCKHEEMLKAVPGSDRRVVLSRSSQVRRTWRSMVVGRGLF